MSTALWECATKGGVALSSMNVYIYFIYVYWHHNLYRPAVATEPTQGRALEPGLPEDINVWRVAWSPYSSWALY